MHLWPPYFTEEEYISSRYNAPSVVLCEDDRVQIKNALKGKSETAFAKEIGINRTHVYGWLNSHRVELLRFSQICKVLNLQLLNKQDIEEFMFELNKQLYVWVCVVCVCLFCVFNTSLSSGTVLSHPWGVPRPVDESPMGFWCVLFTVIKSFVLPPICVLKGHRVSRLHGLDLVFWLCV